MQALIAAMLIAATPSGDLPALAHDVVPDGRLDPAEWKGARVVKVEEMRVRLGRRGDVLVVAVELDRPGISSLVVGTADRVWVLHASAALGTGEYRCAADGTCTRTREFEFTCRDPSSTPAAEACRKEFRSAEGWIGNVGPSGTRTREFLIDLRRFGAGAAPLSVLVTGLALPDQARRWPAGDDDAGSLRLQQGFLEERVRFSPRSWLAVGRSAARPEATPRVGARGQRSIRTGLRGSGRSESRGERALPGSLVVLADRFWTWWLVPGEEPVTQSGGLTPSPTDGFPNARCPVASSSSPTGSTRGGSYQVQKRSPSPEALAPSPPGSGFSPRFRVRPGAAVTHEPLSPRHGGLPFTAS